MTDRQLGRRGPARRDPRGGGGQQAARRVDELREEPDAQRAAEREHAELQKLQAQRRTASARRASTELRAAMQVHAYHACQAGPHAAEFRRIVKEARKEVRAGALGRGASSHGSVSYAQCLRGRYVRTCGLSANEQKELRKQLDPIVLPKRDLNGLNGAVVVWDAAANECT